MTAYRHIGLYAYRCAFLHAYSALAPAPIERFEALEQLRALWHGFRIAVRVSAAAPGAGVDTEEDLARVRCASGREPKLPGSIGGREGASYHRLMAHGECRPAAAAATIGKNRNRR